MIDDDIWWYVWGHCSSRVWDIRFGHLLFRLLLDLLLRFLRGVGHTVGRSIRVGRLQGGQVSWMRFGWVCVVCSGFISLLLSSTCSVWRVVDVIWGGGHLLSGAAAVLSPADIQPDWPPSSRLLD